MQVHCCCTHSSPLPVLNKPHQNKVTCRAKGHSTRLHVDELTACMSVRAVCGREHMCKAKPVPKQWVATLLSTPDGYPVHRQMP